MNIHHLELYYYVATHGGISRAVRHMPYGIQQPAVSSQILQLEEELGTRLFERMPFKLTPAGEELYAAICPFFASLDDLAPRIAKKNVPRLRIGAAEMVLSDYLPPILTRLKKRHPELRLALKAMGSPEVERLFSEREIDIAISPIDRRPAGRLRHELLLKLPLCLLVPKSSKWKTAEQVWSSEMLHEALICLNGKERICEIFHAELKRRRLDWAVSIEASSIALLKRYVENGYGVGVSIQTPDLPRHKDIRVIPLPSLSPVELLAIWQTDDNPLVDTLLEEIRRYVSEEWPKQAVSGA
jgi:DNA-binding transcriptional LysR family regulator